MVLLGDSAHSFFVFTSLMNILNPNFPERDLLVI
jgi:hypothetical protein